MRQYDYILPPECIATYPAVPRDSSKLLVYNTQTDKITIDSFLHIDRYVPSNSLLVLNNTKVLPARIEMKKATSGMVRALFLVNEMQRENKGLEDIGNRNRIRIFVDRKSQVGERLYFDNRHFVTVVGQKEHIFTVEFDFSVERLFSLLEHRGTMPIPLYIKKTPLSKSELRQKYQTIFAQDKGSAAAPTASLHFTNRVFSKLEQKGIQKAFVTLHVGLGTFAPVTEKNMQEKKLHEEWYEVPQQTAASISIAKQEEKKIIAVGTTVVRTLESIYNLESRVQNSRKTNNKILNSKLIGKTDKFIYPPYHFQMVDLLITNFHLPGTSLMMLVDAFLEHKKATKRILELYSIAIQNNFRFYSFGDVMLIL